MSMAARTARDYIQMCRIQQDRIRGLFQGGHRPVHVAVVPRLDIGQHRGLVDRLAPAPEFQNPAPCPLLGRRGHEDFNLGMRAR